MHILHFHLTPRGRSLRVSLSILLVMLICSSSASATPPRYLPEESRATGIRGFFDYLTPRKSIPTNMMGVNAFANDPRFGSVRQQYAEVKGTLRLKYVRVLFAWNDQVQPTPSSPINFSFYDDIASHIPRGTEALVVLTGIPSWMRSSSNWIDGDPRKTFVELWVKPVVTRYASRSRLKAWQIWNEPNMTSDPHNTTLGLASSPANYVHLASLARDTIRSIAPTRKVVSAATTAINQNYPRSLNYNKEMKSAGLEAAVDIWAVHYYGAQPENVIRPQGVGSFLKGVSLPLWVTESGKMGTTKQREYVERIWPFLRSEIPGIKRLYYYQFTEATPANSTYGLRNLTQGRTVSDLYIYLRDRFKSSAKK